MPDQQIDAALGRGKLTPFEVRVLGLKVNCRPEPGKMSQWRTDPMSSKPKGHSSLPNPTDQAAAFQQVREARRNELFEDYVELIDDLVRTSGEARQVDIAARLGVAQPTVARALTRLGDAGLVERKPYRGVFLSDAGRKLAREGRERHAIVEAFLIDIGVDPETARIDTEGIEHHVSAATLRVFRAFSEKKRGGKKS